jgi:predicted negative regulator of RcsB-dependent stress response
LTRHELKEQLQHDPLTDNVELAVDYVTTHRQVVLRWVIIGLAVLVIAALGAWYFQHEKAVRQQALRNALDIVEAQVTPQPNSFAKTFPTQQAKDQASMKALADVASRYSGSDEGRAAQYYLASFQADNGKYSEAENNFKQVADSRSSYSSLGKVALAQLYAGEGKVGEAKTILDGLIQHPTPLVSKEQAQLLLANLLKDSNPGQAKQLAESLKTPQQRPQIQRAIDQTVQGLK